MRRVHLAPLLGLTSLLGCPIEPSHPSAVPTFRDGGTVVVGADARPADAATPVIRCDEVTPCAGGLSCSRAGVCVALGGACADESACADPEHCAGGVCVDVPGRCDPADPNACPGGRCTAAGWCGPRARVLDDRLAAECATSADCGATGRCRAGVCAPCELDSDCPGARVCAFDGTCAEPIGCRSASDCFPGNACVSGACKPSSSGCRLDPNDDSAAGAVRLAEGATLTPSLCGDDVDWWTFSLPATRSARVVVQTSPRQNGAAVHLEEARERAADVAALSLPGLTVLEIASATVSRDFRLQISRLDAAGPYRVVLTRGTDACAGDALDLYGDEADDDALELTEGSSLLRRACPGDVDRARISPAAGDAWRAAPLVVDDGVITAELSELGGAALASGQFTRSSTAVLAPARPAGPASWLLSTSAQSVPAAGTGYLVALSRVRGTRIAACEAAMVLGAGSHTVTLGPDVGAAAACAPTGSLDRLVRIDPPRAGALLHLTARPTSTAARARVALSLASACADDAAAIDCELTPQPGGAASLERVMGSAPLWATISSTTAGDVALSVAFDERGDYTCRLQSATPILMSGDLPVDTRAATNTVEADGTACELAGGQGAGPDRFYALDLGAGERAALELVGARGGLLWVATDCERMNQTCVGAAESALGAPGRLLLEAGARAQSYVIAVDGVSSGDGAAMTLRARLRPECTGDTECMAPLRCDDYACVGPPPSDRCDGVLVPLVGGRAVIAASTGAAHDDFVSARCSSPTSGQDVVFAVDVPAGVRALRARVLEAAWDPILQIRSTCGTSTAELACDDDGGGALLPDVRVATPAAGRYFVIVDAYAGSGPFRLELSAN